MILIFKFKEKNHLLSAVKASKMNIFRNHFHTRINHVQLGPKYSEQMTMLLLEDLLFQKNLQLELIMDHFSVDPEMPTEFQLRLIELQISPIYKLKQRKQPARFWEEMNTQISIQVQHFRKH